MAVAIRLRREGTRNRAFYRIVVADSRARREGRFIEMIGTYDPHGKGVNYKVDIAKADDWISKGAQPSDTVRSLLKRARKDPAPVEEAPPKEEAAPAPKPVAAAKEEPKKEPAAPAAEAKKEPAAPAAEAKLEAAPEEAPAKEAASEEKTD
jgi:small subunit ribosomal protein S16